MSPKQRVRSPILLAVLLALLAACQSGPTATPGSSTAPLGSVAAPKTLRILADFEPSGFSELNSGQDSPINRPMWQMMHDFMVVFDPNGAPIPRLVTELPSQERGTWSINPDGTMETTYHLKRGVHWHDGTELTADDMVMGWKVAVDPTLPYNRRAVATAIDHLETPDPYTVVAFWKQTYPWADRIQPNDWDPMPEHIIGGAYGADPSGLTKLDYWRGEFVGLGAYQLTSWEPGSGILMQANRDYHLGPPKIDRIEVRFVLDENARLATLLARDADMIAAQMGTLGLESRRVLTERWNSTGGGSVTPQGAASFNSLMPKWSNPFVGGARNTATRQALLFGLDREALAEVAQGDASLVVDSWIYPNVPEFDAIKDRIVRYPRNLDRAAQLLRDAGWRPGADGILLSAQGERFEVEIRAEERAAAVIRDSWRGIGVDATIAVASAALARNQEWQAAYPGFVTTGTTPTPSAMLDGRFHSRNCPSEANRWGGQNRQCYQNLEIDRLVDRVFVSIDEAQRWDLEGEIARIVTQEAAIFPTYRSPRGYAILRRGITGVPIMQVLGQSGDLQVTYNIAEWDMGS